MKVKVYKLIYVVSIFTVIYSVFVSSNTDNPLRLSSLKSQIIYEVMPQGWAFFTRNAKERVVKLHKVENERITYINGIVSLSLMDLFGVKRHKRRISIELSEILSQMNKTEKWGEFRNVEVIKAINTIQLSDTIKNKFTNKLLDSGEYVVYASKRKPWAWATSKTSLPYKLKKIYIE